MTIYSKQINRTLVNGAGEVQIQVNECRYVRCTENSGAAFEIAIGDDNVWQEFTSGQNIRIADTAPAFNSIRLRNNSGADVDVELRTGGGGFDDDRLKYTGTVMVEAASPLPVYQVFGTFVTSRVSIANNTVGQVLAAADPTRKKLTVRNPNAAGGADIFLNGSATGNNTDGFELKPLESVEIANTDTIYCWQNSGGAVAVPIVVES